MNYGHYTRFNMTVRTTKTIVAHLTKSQKLIKTKQGKLNFSLY